MNKKLQAFIIVSLIAVLGTVLILHGNANPAEETHTTTSAPVKTTPKPLTYPVASEVFTLVNNERVKAGLQPLVELEALDESATEKCQHEMVNHYHAHISPDGVSWETFIRNKVGLHPDVSENLAWDYDTSAETVAGWMHSPPHRTAILNPDYHYVGYAVCDIHGGSNKVVEHFSS